MADDSWFVGKGCLVTGANTGIGRATALEMAKRGAHVFVACRSEEKGREATELIKRESGKTDVEFLKLDLSSLASVREAAAKALASGVALAILINNAGVAGQRGITKDGFELQFGTNHLGHFLLTELLLERMKELPHARIVNVSSKAHYDARGLDFSVLQRSTPTFAGLREYAVSKLANVLFTRELAKRLAGTGVHVYALHPGVVASDAWRRIPWPIRAIVTRGMISNEEGAQTSLYCATSEAAGKETGLYYDRCKPKEPSSIALDDALAQRLWSESEAWIRSARGAN